MGDLIEVQRSDLLKIQDVMLKAKEFLERRDEMNALVLVQRVHYSPLTMRVQTELDRLDAMIGSEV